MSRNFRKEIDRRIALLERTRDTLDNCIGCGRLSLKKMRTVQPGDRLGAEGPGPRQVLGRL
ncbi:hypothetical protein OK349_01090 [Sphingomonas sp. BT-65]|uniref:hypothetical protein n=1 Tax=Sphingomonas sp. BT-65 TaxID=2989821 RepID=UPI0022362285|nr:hypothetical protein [Sphingomonas sp. BT-65]MCW4460287.1 hypothetical protein [Sphingomonas sp. BT-65]